MRRYSDAEGLPRVLVTLTGDPEASVRKAALEAIGIARHPGCEGAIRARLADPIPFVRAHAARALGALRACSAARAMLPLLADREWLVRSAAKQSLEAMGREIAPLVLEMLSHEDAFARNGAAEVLQNLGMFDALVAGHASGAADVDTLRTVEALAGAAGPRMWDAVQLRLNDAARARALVASAGIPPAR
jgi:HEAT repeat protein